MRYIDDFLNKITMYRLVFYYLLILLGVAVVFSAFGVLRMDPIALVTSTLIIAGACLGSNWLIAKIFRAPTNAESGYITAFILALIISPIQLAPFDFAGFWFLIAASVFAMASKYILAIQKKHIFNPAGIAVVLTGFLMNQYASWWVGGNAALLAFVLIGGLLVARKLQHFDLVLAFFATGLASIVLTNLDFNIFTTIEKEIVHTTLLFFGFVMLTEPLTTPPTRSLRIAYGILVGAIFSPAIHLGSIYSTPEIALAVGNVFSFAVSPKRKYMLTLREKKEIARDTYDFAFDAEGLAGGTLKFNAGQYMEFTLKPPARIKDFKGHDLRGNRRYFTIASAPSESGLHLGVKFQSGGEHGPSSFKKIMLALQPGDGMMAGSLAGDFTLPGGFGTANNFRAMRSGPTGAPKKVAFLAGGIGVTPFRSMIKYASDLAKEGKGKSYDLVLLYSNRKSDEIAYREVFDEAARTVGLKTFYLNTETDGRADAASIRRDIPDWHERTFFLSGPRGMVTSFEKILHELGVPRTHIKTDFFPGFA